MESESAKTLYDFQDRWVKLVDKSTRDFDSLTIDERVWFTVQCLIDQVNNGGLISHYYNNGAEYNKETIEDLEFLGFSDVADLVRKVNTLFPNGEVPKYIYDRNAAIVNWADNEFDSLFDDLDIKFYKKAVNLEKKLVEHIEKHL